MRTLLAAMTVVLLSVPCWATNYFIDPLGSDSNNGTSSGTPWKTFAFAINPLRATCGDTLILAPGNYGDIPGGGTTGTGKLSIFGLHCSAGNELTVTAQDSRKSRIFDSGQGYAVRLRDCSGIIIDGLYARSTDLSYSSTEGAELGELFTIQGCSNLILRNNIGVNPNRYGNNNVYNASRCTTSDGCNPQINYSSNIVFEDNECYWFHRHCVATEGVNIRVTRQYANPRGFGASAGGKIPGGYFGDAGAPVGSGASAFSMYPCQGCILENSFYDCTTNSGYLNEQNATYAFSIKIDQNQVVGNIAYKCNPYGVGVYAQGRNVLDLNHTPTNGIIRNNAFIDWDTTSRAILCQDCINYVMDHNTIRSNNLNGTLSNGSTSAATGIELLDAAAFGATLAQMTGNEVTNNVVYDRPLQGIIMRGGGWLADTNNSFSNVPNYSPSSDPAGAAQTFSNNISIDPAYTSTCKGLWVPAGFPMKGIGTNGSDLGATILNRTVNGVLTTDPLWDPNTGELPFGAADSDGINRVAGNSYFDLHTRLGVGPGLCPFPAGYGAGGGGAPSTVVQGGTSISGDCTTTCSWPMTVAANQNELIVLLALREDTGNVGSVATVTSSGEDLTLVKRGVTSPGWRACEIWHRTSPTNGSRTINVTTTGSVSGMVGRSIEFDVTDGLNTGVSAASPPNTPTSSSSVTAPTNTNELIVDCIATSPSVTLTAGADQTAMTNVSHTTKSIMLGVSTQNGSDGGVMSWSTGGAIYMAQAAVSLNAAPVDPPTTATLEVSKFRIRRLLGTEVDAEYLAVNNVHADIGVDGAARVRIEITGGVATTSPFGVWLYCRKNADALTRVLDSFSGNVFRLYGPDVISNIPASFTPTTCQLGAAGCVPGAVIRDQASTFVVPALTVGQRIEMEWAIQLNATVDDVINCYPKKDDGTALDTLTVTPTINAVKASSQAGF